jgi:hypothetical protein
MRPHNPSLKHRGRALRSIPHATSSRTRPGPRAGAGWGQPPDRSSTRRVGVCRPPARALRVPGPVDARHDGSGGASPGDVPATHRGGTQPDGPRARPTVALPGCVEPRDQSRPSPGRCPALARARRARAERHVRPRIPGVGRPPPRARRRSRIRATAPGTGRTGRADALQRGLLGRGDRRDHRPHPRGHQNAPHAGAGPASQARVQLRNDLAAEVAP